MSAHNDGRRADIPANPLLTAIDAYASAHHEDRVADQLSDGVKRMLDADAILRRAPVCVRFLSLSESFEEFDFKRGTRHWDSLLHPDELLCDVADCRYVLLHVPESGVERVPIEIHSHEAVWWLKEDLEPPPEEQALLSAFGHRIRNWRLGQFPAVASVDKPTPPTHSETGAPPEASAVLPTNQDDHQIPPQAGVFRGVQGREAQSQLNQHPTGGATREPQKAPVSAKRRRNKGDALLLLAAALDSLAMKGHWGKTDTEIIAAAGISRDSFYRLKKEDKKAKAMMAEYRNRTLGRGPVRADGR